MLFVPLQRREALRSSSMEGTYATPEELLLYQIDPRDPASQDDEVNAWRDVFSYGKAPQPDMNLLDQGLPISLRLVRQLHAALLGGVDALFVSPPTTIPQAASLTEVTYPTAKSDIERLVGLGVLIEGPAARVPRYFCSPELFKIAYEDY